MLGQIFIFKYFKEIFECIKNSLHWALRNGFTILQVESGSGLVKNRIHKLRKQTLKLRDWTRKHRGSSSGSSDRVLEGSVGKLGKTLEKKGDRV